MNGNYPEEQYRKERRIGGRGVSAAAIQVPSCALVTLIYQQVFLGYLFIVIAILLQVLYAIIAYTI